MECSSPGVGDGINSFALVTYVPDPLGSFLDSLRRDLVAGCTARSHVTILPPRPLAVHHLTATAGLEIEVQRFEPFTVDLNRVEVFEATSVVYLAIGSGAADLHRMHERLNRNHLAFDEPYPYHPHVTLAQGVSPDQVLQVLNSARRQWAAFDAPRSFTLDQVTFVQNTVENRWLDLEHLPLASAADVLALR